MLRSGSALFSGARYYNNLQTARYPLNTIHVWRRAAIMSFAIAFVSGCSSTNNPNDKFAPVPAPPPAVIKSPLTSSKHSVSPNATAAATAASTFYGWNIYTPASSSSSGSTGIVLQVSQGSTVFTAWRCINGNGQPCPSGVTSSWSSQYVPSGMTTNFDPAQTSGGATSIEYFTVSPNASPGNYQIYTCISTNSGSDAPCKWLTVQVIAASSNPFPTPPPVDLVPTVKLQISTVSSNGITVPGEGHLYVQIYYNGQPGIALQAGDYNGLLEAATFTQYPLSQPGVDITSYVYLNSMSWGYTRYRGFQLVNKVPAYNAVTMNSNSWADGLLLASHMSEDDIDRAVSALESATGLDVTGYQNGSVLLPCFEGGGVAMAAAAQNCENVASPGIRHKSRR